MVGFYGGFRSRWVKVFCGGFVEWLVVAHSGGRGCLVDLVAHGVELQCLFITNKNKNNNNNNNK